MPSSSAPSRARSDAVLARRLRWLIVLRLVIATTALVPLVLLHLAQPLSFESVDFVYDVVGLLYLLCLLWIALQRLLPRRPRLQAWCQMLGDVLVVSLLVYHLGGAANHFSILYLAVIALTAVFLDRRAALIIAALSWLAYFGVVLAFEAGWLELPVSGLYVPLTPARLAYDLAIQLTGFLAIAWLMSHRVLDTARAHRELEHQQTRFADLAALQRDLFASAPSGLLLANLQHHVLAINPAARDLLGTSQEAVRGRGLDELGLLPPPQAANTEQTAEPQRWDLSWAREDGVRLLEAELSVLRRESGEAIGHLLVLQDWTERLQLEERLRLQDRMAAVGELASGVAHEIGNPLTAISGSVQMLSQRAGRDEDRELLDIIRRETDRLSRTVRSLLEFTRPRARQDRRFDACALLRESVELLRNSSELLSGHRLELQLPDGTIDLVADRDQISQVFWNLARNSLRAMPSGGTLQVEGRRAGHDFLLRVRDDGRGMNEEQRANVFHPFRSFFDGGTGMGMAIVYRIVEEHDGLIQVDSAPGAGTTITVALPLPVGTGEEAG